MSRASHPEACHGVGFGVEAYRYHTHNTSSRLIATTRNNSSPTYVRTSRHVLRSSGIGGGVLVVSSHDGHASPGPSGKERPRAGQVHLRRYVRERMYPERRHSAGGHGAIGLHLPRAVYPAFGPDLPHSWRLVCGQFRKVREGGGRDRQTETERQRDRERQRATADHGLPFERAEQGGINIRSTPQEPSNTVARRVPYRCTNGLQPDRADARAPT